ncbi:MAG: DinB family protein [bacterium]
MNERSLFTKFWTNESETTRKVIARVPEGSDYRPDANSRTAKDIAWQILCEERMLIEAFETGTAQWAPPPMPATMKEVIDAYDAHSAEMPDRWARVPGEQWDGTLEFFGRPRSALSMAWGFLFDVVHHRGQLTTYLRPMGAKVPQIYGPSFDEP